MPLSRDPEKREKQLQNLRPAPPAPPGNDHNLQHGGWSVVAVRDRAETLEQSIAQDLAESVPLRDHAGRAPVPDRHAIGLLASCLARLELMQERVTEADWDVLSPKSRSAEEQMARLRIEAAGHCDRLGLNPAARVKLGLDLAQADQIMAASRSAERVRAVLRERETEELDRQRAWRETRLLFRSWPASLLAGPVRAAVDTGLVPDAEDAEEMIEVVRRSFREPILPGLERLWQGRAREFGERYGTDERDAEEVTWQMVALASRAFEEGLVECAAVIVAEGPDGLDRLAAEGDRLLSEVVGVVGEEREVSPAERPVVGEVLAPESVRDSEGDSPPRLLVPLTSPAVRREPLRPDPPAPQLDTTPPRF